MKQKLLLISLILSLVLMGFASSNVTASSGIAAYYVGPGESYKVTLNGAEWFITNKTASTIFIPARTLAEQQSFINNAPSGVAVNYFIACPSNNTFTDSRDGNVYPTVQIGSQCWMAKNLAYLPSVVGSGTGSETTPYYYVYGYQGTNVYDAKATSNYTTHGVLYNYPAAMSACPYGWKLPTDTEWNVLEQYVVDQIASLNPQYPCSTSETGWRRCADSTGTDQGANGVGQALKESGLGSGVGLGTNLVGFSSKLSGRRSTDHSFNSMGSYTYFWSSTGSGSSAWNRYLNTSYSTVYRRTLSKAAGFSVRCLRN
jgi:uncharacterized protein (TIGR02145 family)